MGAVLFITFHWFDKSDIAAAASVLNKQTPQ